MSAPLVEETHTRSYETAGARFTIESGAARFEPRPFAYETPRDWDEAWARLESRTLHGRASAFRSAVAALGEAFTAAVRARPWPVAGAFASVWLALLCLWGGLWGWLVVWGVVAAVMWSVVFEAEADSEEACLEDLERAAGRTLAAACLGDPAHELFALSLGLEGELERARRVEAQDEHLRRAVVAIARALAPASVDVCTGGDHDDRPNR